MPRHKSARSKALCINSGCLCIKLLIPSLSLIWAHYSLCHLMGHCSPSCGQQDPFALPVAPEIFATCNLKTPLPVRDSLLFGMSETDGQWYFQREQIAVTCIIPHHFQQDRLKSGVNENQRACNWPLVVLIISCSPFGAWSQLPISWKCLKSRKTISHVSGILTQAFTTHRQLSIIGFIIVFIQNVVSELTSPSFKTLEISEHLCSACSDF